MMKVQPPSRPRRPQPAAPHLGQAQAIFTAHFLPHPSCSLGQPASTSASCTGQANSPSAMPTPLMPLDPGPAPTLEGLPRRPTRTGLLAHTGFSATGGFSIKGSPGPRGHRLCPASGSPHPLHAERSCWHSRPFPEQSSFSPDQAGRCFHNVTVISL